MELMDKLKILTDSAKYDAACTSSGVDRKGTNGKLGSAAACGICHSFASDGRCISLLKVLMTNSCIYDCQYCVNRRTNDRPRAAFTPRELADLTMNFYRRNYIEGLFLSSAVIKNPDYTCQLMGQALRILRDEYGFGGYIHVKAIPGADPRLIDMLGLLADRMSVNIELPSKESLQLLAPEKTKENILKPMEHIRNQITDFSSAVVPYKPRQRFVPGGQSTQMIIGATPDTDYKILMLSEGLYKKYGLKRVFYSAYMPVQGGANLPSVDTKPPLLREHRLYQADWLLRFYGFRANELLDAENTDFNTLIDPKCNWALNNMQLFPIDVAYAPYEMLLRIPGIGVLSAQRIVKTRKATHLTFDGLKKIGVVMKRAQYFILCNGAAPEGLKIGSRGVASTLLTDGANSMFDSAPQQLTLF